MSGSTMVWHDANVNLNWLFKYPPDPRHQLLRFGELCFHLLSSPPVYQKLQDEITTGIREGRISTPITNEEARCLPYLQVSKIPSWCGLQGWISNMNRPSSMKGCEWCRPQSQVFPRRSQPVEIRSVGNLSLREQIFLSIFGACCVTRRYSAPMQESFDPSASLSATRTSGPNL